MVTRRGLLVGAGVGGALVVAYTLQPRHYPSPLEPIPGQVNFDAWLRIGRDGVVSVAVPQLEMGQGITTLLPQIVAMELGADWRRVAVEPAPISAAYANVPLAARWAEMWMPAFADAASEPGNAVARRFAETTLFTATADGMSLSAHEGPARAAAAGARAMLAMAAADRWDVAWEECDAVNGYIVHGDKRLSFGKLVEEAASYDPPDPPVLRADAPAEVPGQFPAGGALNFPRLDLPAKVDGTFQFAGDIRLPGMVYAAIRHGPMGETTLSSFDKASSTGIRGVVGIVRGENWLAAVASNWWAAEQALKAMTPRFKVKAAADSNMIEAAMEEGLRRGDETVIAQAGDPYSVLSDNFSLALRYDVAPALHATLETASVTARFENGRLELWLATQAPEAARRAAAQALDISLRDVVLYPMAAGGSYDRRLEHDHAIEAAVIAKEVGKPVQLVWSRWQEHIAGLPRTPAGAVMAARTSPDGSIIGWKARIAVPPTAKEFGHRLFDGLTSQAAMEKSAGKSDAMAVEGAVPPYAIPNLVIEHVPVEIGLPTARMCGNAHGYTAFFTESFVDELAHKFGREPLSYRMAMLGHDLKLAHCLQRAATLSMWGGGGDNSGQGLACHRIGEGRIAVIATARRDENGVRVDRLTAVADIGRIVNVDIARQQIEGGLVFGLGLALGGSTGYAEGIPLNGRLGSLGLPLLGDCPNIDVDFIESSADPVDPGELGTAAVAPAVANALFSATGLRFRRLPLLSEEI